MIILGTGSRRYYAVMRRFVLASAFILIAFPSVAGAHAPEELLVRMTADGFVPEEIEVHAGDTVTFLNEDAREHWPASNLHPTHTAYPGSSIDKCGTDEASRIFDACRGLPSGETYSFIFDTPGSWKYHDHLAAGESGTITIAGEPGEDEPAAEPGFSLGAWLAGLWEGIVRWFERLYYALRPSALDAALAGVSLLDAAHEDGPALERWLSLIGTKEYMERMREEAESTGLDCHTPAHVIGRASYELF